MSSVHIPGPILTYFFMIIRVSHSYQSSGKCFKLLFAVQTLAEDLSDSVSDNEPSMLRRAELRSQPLADIVD